MSWCHLFTRNELNLLKRQLKKFKFRNSPSCTHMQAPLHGCALATLSDQPSNAMKPHTAQINSKMTKINKQQHKLTSSTPQPPAYSLATLSLTQSVSTFAFWTSSNLPTSPCADSLYLQVRICLYLGSWSRILCSFLGWDSGLHLRRRWLLCRLRGRKVARRKWAWNGLKQMQW